METVEGGMSLRATQTISIVQGVLEMPSHNRIGPLLNPVSRASAGVARLEARAESMLMMTEQQVLHFAESYSLRYFEYALMTLPRRAKIFCAETCLSRR